MRILIGYDGSVPADGALFDLSHAGLPSGAEALVLTAALPWIPYSYGPAGDPAADGWGVLQAASLQDLSRQALEDAAATAERGARFLRGDFPEWKVKSEGVLDDAAHGLLSRAEAWKADLIALGAPAHSPLERLLSGSVAHKVMNHACAGVRVGRPRLGRRDRAPVLMLAMDGSAGAEAALETLVARTWPKGTEVRVAAVVDGRTAYEDVMERQASIVPGRPVRAGKARLKKQVLTWIERRVEAACARLSSARLRAVPMVLAGDPRRVLLKEAEDWDVQSLFMGARGLNPVARFVLGSVSSTVAAHAPCSVEVVHSTRISALNLSTRPAPKRNSRRQR